MNGYKMQTTYLLVVFAIVVQQIFAAEFMQKCKVSDPNFDECVLNSANSFISTVIKGNEKYGIPARPLVSSTRTYNLSENFSLKFKNLSTNFYQNLVITRIHFDFQKKQLIFGARSSQVQYASDYEADGEILGKPVHESGKVNMTFDHVELNATVTLGFKMKNDKKYLEAVSCKLAANSTNFQFKPHEQVTVREPMTAEQKTIYQSYIDKIPEMFKRDSERLDKDLVEILNNILELLPFEEIFIT